MRADGNNVSGATIVPASAPGKRKGRPKGGLCCWNRAARGQRSRRSFGGVVGLHLAGFLGFFGCLLAHLVLRHVVALAHGVAGRRGGGAPGLVLSESGRGEKGRGEKDRGEKGN